MPLDIKEPASNLVLSLAEWEYAYRYYEFISLGDPKPDSTGFDSERIREIERVLRGHFRESNQVFFGSPRE